MAVASGNRRSIPILRHLPPHNCLNISSLVKNENTFRLSSRGGKLNITKFLNLEI